MSISGESIDWSDVVKKEARGIDNADLGEVQEIGQNYVMTQRGVISRDKFFIPKYMVEGYDGHTLWFNVSDVQLEQFKRDTPPAYEEYSARYRTPEVRSDIETRIPLIAEKLDVNKRVLTSEATIVKEPVTETKTIEVPVTHEELRVERRPASESTAAAAATEGPVTSRTEIRVPLTREEVEVTKTPYVKEEVVVKKDAVTETRTVSDTVTSERVETAEEMTPANSSSSSNSSSNPSGTTDKTIAESRERNITRRS
ncbi:MAG: YsnF/AvaK domain-containing protein [Thermoproteota archaeon]